MILRLWYWFFGKREAAKPQPYAVFMVERYGDSRSGHKQYCGKWVKAVVSVRPDRDPRVPEPVIGPFRSEIDCEEYIGSANK